MIEVGNVLIAAPVHYVLIEGLTARGYNCLMHEDITQQLAYALIADCVGVITSTRLQLDQSLLDVARQLKWIGRMGSGMEVIDVPYARSKSINCFASPEGNSNAVAEHAMGMLLSLIRHIGVSNNEIKRGLWLREENRGSELEGKTIGIIGFGHTGRAFARKLVPFDMNIMAYDTYPQQDWPDYVERCNSLQPIFDRADIISFHVPLQEDTRHYFSDNFMTNMSKSFILINTSRGIVADTKIIFEGLQSGKIRGVCLDVWEEEPLEMMSEQVLNLLKSITALPQAIVTPHIAGYTHEALFKMSKILLDKIINT